MQKDINPNELLPSRADLSAGRLAIQEKLLSGNIDRFTPIQVTTEGVIWDGHHAVRAAADDGRTVDVLVVNERLKWSGMRIVDLPVR